MQNVYIWLLYLEMYVLHDALWDFLITFTMHDGNCDTLNRDNQKTLNATFYIHHILKHSVKNLCHAFSLRSVEN